MTGDRACVPCQCLAFPIVLYKQIVYHYSLLATNADDKNTAHKRVFLRHLVDRYVCKLRRNWHQFDFGKTAQITTQQRLTRDTAMSLRSMKSHFRYLFKLSQKILVQQSMVPKTTDLAEDLIFPDSVERK